MDKKQTKDGPGMEFDNINFGKYCSLDCSQKDAFEKCFFTKRCEKSTLLKNAQKHPYFQNCKKGG